MVAFASSSSTCSETTSTCSPRPRASARSRSGIAGFETRVARCINSRLGRRGKLFPDRYHARALRTPREVRNALAYVLLNRKHHAAEQKFARYWIDPCSSAAWFTGWAQRGPR